MFSVRARLLVLAGNRFGRINMCKLIWKKFNTLIIYFIHVLLTFWRHLTDTDIDTDIAPAGGYTEV